MNDRYLIGSRKMVPFLQVESDGLIQNLAGNMAIVGGNSQIGMFCRILRYLSKEERIWINEPSSTLLECVLKKWVKNGKISSIPKILPILKV